jgi:hypothetical protein
MFNDELFGVVKVMATSRFPQDAAARYAEEKDFSEWSSRLHLFGLDFRDLAALEEFCALLCKRCTRLVRSRFSGVPRC